MENSIPADDDATPRVMSKEQTCPMPLHAVAESLRRKHRLSPTLQQIIELNRRDHERERDAVRALTRGFTEHMRKYVETNLKLDPDMVCQIPDDVVDSLLSSLGTLKALEDIPGAKMTFSFKSEVTVNGVRIPDEE